MQHDCTFTRTPSLHNLKYAGSVKISQREEGYVGHWMRHKHDNYLTSTTFFAYSRDMISSYM